ncbi:Endothelin-converting enzyme-like 1 isoform X2 [Aphelenchoides fujianensis]|nr:Endothelin-converting enzyme-like 1 isoform X2 [Aphelenchoides fujianensis]
MRLFNLTLLLLLLVYDANGFQTPQFLAKAFGRFVGFFSSSSSNSSLPLPPTLLLNIPEPEVIGGDAEASVRQAFADAAAFIRERLNTTADLCNNFFQYACCAQKSHETVFQSMDVQVRRLMMRAMREQPTNPLTMKAHAYLERCFAHFKRPNYSEGVEEVRFLLTHLPHWRFPAVVHSAANLPALTGENVAHTFGVLHRFAGVNFGLRLRFERLPAPLITFELDTLAGHDQLASFAEVMGVASGVFGEPLDWSGMEAPVRRAHDLVWSRMERENEHLTTATEDIQLQHVDEKYPNFRLSTYLKTVTSGVPELEALLQPTTTVRLPTSFLAGLNAAVADARLTPVRAVAFVSLVNFRLFEGMFRPAAAQERAEESDRFERGPAATSMRTTGGETDCVFDSRGLGILMSRLLLETHFSSADARERHENPFFDVNFPRSIRYGRLGWSMGHEMAHAFDPVLFDYDEHFNHRHLLLNTPRLKFAQSVECLVREYDRIDPENHGSTTENTEGKPSS